MDQLVGSYNWQCIDPSLLVSVDPIGVNELCSPIQFGQATRLAFSIGITTIVSGVTASHLADDFVECNRAFQHTCLTAGSSLSLPGAGIDSVLDVESPSWVGGFLDVVFSY